MRETINAKPRRVLIIDDDASVYKVLKTWWPDAIIHYAAGPDAAEMYLQSSESSNSPDLIILDLMLNKMDGNVFLPSLKKLAGDTPIALFTATDRAQPAATAIKNGAAAYFVKGSMSWTDLCAALDELIMQYRLRN